MKNQTSIEATREPSIAFLVGKFDGTMGLGFQEISVGNAAPLRYNMIEQGLVEDPIFLSGLIEMLRKRVVKFCLVA